MAEDKNRQPAVGTRRLYFEDPYRREFEAAVVERLESQGRPAVVLDQTCFYPESGGQPADQGVLNGLSVVYVVEEGDRVIHQLAEHLKSDWVKGRIDWARRFNHMQQHTGQHILSQCFIEVLGGETKSFHLGEAVSTLEIGIREAGEAEIERVENRANEIVFSDLEVKTYFVPPDEIGAIPLRRPPKKSGVIRVVEISGFDYSACGGTHCRRTGEVGLIKIIKGERIRGNVRFEFLCGGRAWRDYAWKNRILVDLAARLSLGEKDVGAAIEKMFQESKEARKRLRRLEEQLAEFEAREIIERSEGLIITEIWREKSFEAAKTLALNIIRAGDYAVLFGVSGEDRGHLIFATSEKLPLNMRDLIPVVLSLVQGKGGGSPTLVELVVEKNADLNAVLAAAADFLRAKLAS